MKCTNVKVNSLEFDSLMTVALFAFIVNVTNCNYTKAVYLFLTIVFPIIQWKKRLSAYCAEEFSIKTSHYFCCKKNGKARWSCFDKEASDSSYHVSSEVSNANTPKKIRGFKYNPRACKG